MKHKKIELLIRDILEEDIMLCENYAMMLDTYSHVHDMQACQKYNDLLDAAEDALVKNVIDIARSEYNRGYKKNGTRV